LQHTIIEVLGDYFVKSILEAGKILEKVIYPVLYALNIVITISTKQSHHLEKQSLGE
jgi:hypothetical protein